MGKKRKGKTVKAARLGQIGSQEEAYSKAPHTFVFNRGQVGKNVKQLVRDMRRVMEPYTASHLKARKTNVLKDFVSIAGLLNVSHFIIFTKTDIGMYMRLVRLPRGPTLTFKVKDYSLVKDIVSSLKRHNMEAKQFQHHPLLVINGLSGEGMQMKLMATMFQNMFPSINVTKIKLNDVRRCVLINYSAESCTLDVRHYNIKLVPVGISKGLKKLVKSKVPNMGHFDDISDFLLRGDLLSESEAELDGDHNEVVLSQELAGRGNMQTAKSAVRLTEIGPRLTLQLVKVEDGVCEGTILYHSFVQKTKEEIEHLQSLRNRKKKLKEQRKKNQEENVAKKQQQKEEHKMKSKKDHKSEADGNIEMEEDDDEEYFRQEVGEEPDPDMMIGHKRKSFPGSSNTNKKRKFSKSDNKMESQDRSKTKPLKKQYGGYHVNKNDKWNSHEKEKFKGQKNKTSNFKAQRMKPKPNWKSRNSKGGSKRNARR